MASDPVRDFLEQMQCSKQLIRGGLKGLVEMWEEIVGQIEVGYKLGLDDYLNDMDGRQLLHDAMMLATVEQKKPFLERVRKADERMLKAVEPANKCLWGREIAEEEGWDEEENWWYYMKPRRANPELLEEIEGVEAT